MFFCYFLVNTVSFDKPLHFVDENAGQVQIVLLLGQPSLNDIIVQVLNTDVSATGKHNFVFVYKPSFDFLSMINVVGGDTDDSSDSSTSLLYLGNLYIMQ